jgi:thiamine-monophosphate kinase
MQTVSDVGERGLIKIISEILGGLGNEILSGEDDAVAFRMDNPSTIVVNTDMLVSTTDVPPQMTLFQAARKTVVMTVSDVFVKGAIPKWAVISLGIPNNLPLIGDRGFKGMIKGLKMGFSQFGIQYLGGDLNETQEVVISCTIFGDAPYGVISRSGAKPGDIIVSSGEMGKTGCGFSIIIENKDSKLITKNQKKSYLESVLNPQTPNIALEMVKNKWATASCDSSDGILTTIQEICKGSNVGAQIDWDSLPIAEGVLNFSKETGKNIIDLVFRAGEEFIHIFTIPQNIWKTINSTKLGRKLIAFGKIIDKNGEILLIKDRKEINLAEFSGYEHLSRREK